ncbi:MAG: hypothetical protein C4551_00065 [Bacillota bacterium]|nr:MAG: hypothetical protein C4551_00065 [Bacillota bacterium]
MFVSILVRYPEIARVTYHRETHCLKLAVLVKSHLDEEAVSRLRDLIAKSVKAYARLSGREVRVVDLSVTTREGVSVAEMWRDLDSLTQSELSMTLALLRESFGQELVVDQFPGMDGEDLSFQEELIEEMLEDLRGAKHQPNLIAFREEGRVLIFNR